jgi:NAD(P)-dependent dehydrogenase (short-subunit alcohol dehydrogenase family)
MTSPSSAPWSALIQACVAPRPLAETAARLRAEHEIRETLRALSELGAEVIYESCDSRDQPGLEALCARLRSQQGPITGFIHGAGVLADRLIVDKTAEQFDRVFGTKVEGAEAVLAAIFSSSPSAADDLRSVVFFSSSTARFGRKGQVDYAMANEALNKRAADLQRALPASKILSMNWGPWAGGMVGPELEALFASEGVRLIPEEGRRRSARRRSCCWQPRRGARHSRRRLGHYRQRGGRADLRAGPQRRQPSRLGRSRHRRPGRPCPWP